MTNAMTMTEAAEQLGITRMTLRRLVREGVLPTTDNPLDKRQRLIPESAIRQLQTGSRTPRGPFYSDGAGENAEVQSSDLEAYLEARWRPA